MINTFNDFLISIENIILKEKLEVIFNKIDEQFRSLKKEIKWNQPMYIKDKTFIIGFSVAKHHISIAPEKKALDLFSDEIEKCGYERTKELFKIKEDEDINFDLILKIVDYNIKDKDGYQFFWRKPDFIGKL